MTSWLNQFRPRGLDRFYVDRYGWRHDRPAADWRIRCLVVALPFGGFMQMVTGPAPTSISATAFTAASAWAVLVLNLIAAALVLYAGRCVSQYFSFGAEAAGCGLWVGSVAIQLWALISTNPNAIGTQNLYWLAGWGVGCAIRGIVLVRRIW